MKRFILLVAAGLATASLGIVPAAAAAPPTYTEQGSVNVAPASPKLTAVDPMAWAMFGDVLPARPFLHS